MATQVQVDLSPPIAYSRLTVTVPSCVAQPLQLLPCRPCRPTSALVRCMPIRPRRTRSGSPAAATVGTVVATMSWWGAVSSTLADGATSLAALAESALESDEEEDGDGAPQVAAVTGDVVGVAAGQLERAKAASAVPVAVNDLTVRDRSETGGDGAGSGLGSPGARAGGTFDEGPDLEQCSRGPAGADDGSARETGAPCDIQKPGSAPLHESNGSVATADGAVGGSAVPATWSMRSPKGPGDVRSRSESGSTATSMEDIDLGGGPQHSLVARRSAPTVEVTPGASVDAGPASPDTALRELRRRCASLTAELAEATERCEALASELESAVRARGDAQSAADVLRRQNESLQQQLHEALTRQPAAVEAHATAEKALESARNEADAFRQRCSELEEQLAAARSASTAAEERAAGAEAKLAAQATGIASAEEDGVLQSAIADRDAAEALNGELEAQVADLRASLEQALAKETGDGGDSTSSSPTIGKLASAQSRIKELESVLEAQRGRTESGDDEKDRVAELQRSLSQAQKAHLEAEEAATSARKEVGLCQQRISELTEELARVKNESDALQVAAQKATERAAAAETEASARKAAANAAAASLREDLESAQEEVTQLQAQIRDLKGSAPSQAVVAQEETEALRKALDQAQKDLAQQVAQRDGAVEAYHRLQASFQKLQSDLRESMAREEEIRGAAEKHRADLDAANSLVAELEGLLESERSKLDELDALRAAKDDSAEAVEQMRGDLESQAAEATESLRVAREQSRNARAEVARLSAELSALREQESDQVAELRRQLRLAASREEELLARLDRVEASSVRATAAEAEITALKADLRAREADVARAEASASNLTRVMEQLSADREAEVAAHEEQVRALEDECERLRAEASSSTDQSVSAARETVQAELDAALRRAEHAERVAVVAQQEKAMLRKALDDTMSQFESFQENDLVDRRLVSKLLVTYVSRPHEQREVLALMSKMLEFNEEQRIAVGLQKPPRKSLFEALFGAGGGEPADAESKTVAADGRSLSDMFVDYLIDEVEKREGGATGASGAAAAAPAAGAARDGAQGSREPSAAAAPAEATTASRPGEAAPSAAPVAAPVVAVDLSGIE